MNEIAYSRDGKLFFQGIHSGDVEVLSLPDMQRVRLLRGHTGPVLSLAFDRQERYMATGGTDALVSLWDARDFICLRTFSRMDYPIRSVRCEARAAADGLPLGCWWAATGLLVGGHWAASTTPLDSWKGGEHGAAAHLLGDWERH